MEDATKCEECGAAADGGTMDDQIRQMFCGLIRSSEETFEKYRSAFETQDHNAMTEALEEVVDFLMMVGNGSNGNALRLLSWMNEAKAQMRSNAARMN